MPYFKRRFRSFNIPVKGIISTLLMGMLVTIVLFVPPSTFFSVLVFIVLFGLCLYLLLSSKLRKKYALLIALFIVSWMLLLGTKSFEPLNAILILSLFIGLFILIR